MVNGGGMISWGLRGSNQSKYTKLMARQQAEICTVTTINYTHFSHRILLII